MSQTTMAQSLGRWLDPPLIIPDGQTVQQVLSSLNDHPFAQDETAQDYVMPTKRHLEEPGRFRIWGENQDNFYCFVDAEQACNTDPPVYFETCLDLVRDCEITPEDVLPGNVAMVTTSFRRFLAFMLAHHICLRLEKGRYLAEDVNGIVFSKPLQDCSGLTNPIGRQFLAGYTPYVGDGLICIPDWGAAFRCADVRDSFVKARHPIVGQSWA
jgi:hypothetical protein